ncbi:hypothetical protein [Megasphaera stantonii]|uniref:hypothetical protein n=1 Tax=Megasphaera stantonii TaxID=2144175 RepID=UPI002943CA15|nr:hypothetical protein [Megasphaera stantonii]
MAQENAIFDEQEKLYQDSTEMMNLEELEENLQSQLDESFADLEFLKEEREKIGNPDHLGNVIQSVVWEQFINQVAMTAGEDFIKENRGRTLDLRNSAHIQTTENFAKGKIATHNSYIDYQKRYKDWQDNFVKDANGNIVTHKTRTGNDEATLVRDARKPFDEGRPSGSAKNHTDMDHTVSAAEIIRDPAANAHMTKDEQIAFANSDANLNEMDSSLNRSKGDKSMTDWLDNPNANGQKPNEIFNIDADDEKKLRDKDKQARKEYEKRKREAEKRSYETGRKSQREEAFRIGKTALRSILMQMLADLVKKIIGKLVVWFKSTKRTFDSLIKSIKESIISFVTDIEARLINAGNIALNTIAAAIYGPVFGTIKKVWMLLKQGWRALKDAVDYIRKPENKGKPIDRLILETGKILVAGLTGASAILLGEGIEKGLMTIPVFAIEIPMLGSLANILGIFFGAVVSGITGAIAINLIDKYIEKQQKRENLKRQIDKKNEILETQGILTDVKVKKMIDEKERSAQSIKERHEQAQSVMRDALTTICQEDKNEDSPEIDGRLCSSGNKLDELLS